MDISAIGDSFDGDWFDFEEHLKSMSNGRLYKVMPSSFDDRYEKVTKMMKAPSEASISGGYSQESGFNIQGSITWSNDSGPPARDNQAPQEKENTNNGKDSSSENAKDNDSSASSQAKS